MPINRYSLLNRRIQQHLSSISITSHTSTKIRRQRIKRSMSLHRATGSLLQPILSQTNTRHLPRLTDLRLHNDHHTLRLRAHPSHPNNRSNQPRRRRRRSSVIHANSRRDIMKQSRRPIKRRGNHNNNRHDRPRINNNYSRSRFTRRRRGNTYGDRIQRHPNRMSNRKSRNRNHRPRHLPNQPAKPSHIHRRRANSHTHASSAVTPTNPNSVNIDPYDVNSIVAINALIAVAPNVGDEQTLDHDTL